MGSKIGKVGVTNAERYMETMERHVRDEGISIVVYPQVLYQYKEDV